MSLPTYHAKNIDIDSPFVCFLVHMHSFRYHLWQKFPVSAGYSEMPIAILSSRLRKVKRIVVISAAHRLRDGWTVGGMVEGMGENVLAKGL